MKFTTRLLAPIIILAFAAGCVTTNDVPPPLSSPVGKWVAVEIDGASVKEGQPATMALEEGRVSGGSGCNRYFGGVEIDGDRLTFGAIASTRMMCPPAAMEREQAMFDLMGNARGWRGEGKNMALIDEKGDVLGRFEPQP